MPRNNNNNNQKGQSAADRLVRLPLVRSACSRLTVWYTDTKHSHPGLRTMCEVVENSVIAACDRASPVIVKLGPQISTANDVACQSLDWLESKFPVLHTPTEQIVAIARDRMHEMSTALNGTMGHVHYTVTWMMERMQQVEGTNQTLVARAISVAGLGLDSALSISEALIDRVLPPTEEDNKGAAHLLNGFEAAPFNSYPVRLVSLSTKVFRRTYYKAGAMLHSVQVMETFARCSAEAMDLQATWMRSLQELPQYLQHQAVSLLFFIFQIYTSSWQPSDQNQSSQVIGQPRESENFSAHKGVVQVYPRAIPASRGRKPIRLPVTDNGCMRR